MIKIKKILFYVAVITTFFLIIPEIFLRVLTPEQLARVSDFTSFNETFNPLLSLAFFLGIGSILLALITIHIIRKIYKI